MSKVKYPQNVFRIYLKLSLGTGFILGQLDGEKNVSDWNYISTSQIKYHRHGHL